MKRFSQTLILFLLLMPGMANALPPFDEVIEEVEKFRSESGDIEGSGELTYLSHRGRSVSLERSWGEPPTLSLGTHDLVLDWTDPGVDIVLRLVGIALSAEDLGEAFEANGIHLTERINTIWFLDDRPTYALGTDLEGYGLRVHIDRDTYALVGIDLPAEGGPYVLRLSNFDLADGWFPQDITVTQEGDVLLSLHLTRLSRR
ncbi:MAG: hypothetical protein KC561_15790 [Myxococcales bacterium]|nr:hypothetical protein [Myxococcales bacterium]